MDYIKIRKSTISFLLITLIFMLLPVAGFAAPQQADISKPTRERVKSTDKNKKKKTTDNQSADNAAATNKKATDKKDDKKSQADNKDSKDNKPQQDTTSKPAKPATKPARKPINTDVAKFDGIDVSKHQHHINWAELRKNKRIQYVFIRATVGSDIVDEYYKENVRNARKHGFKVGSYHYMTNLSSIRGQFENFKKTVDKNTQDILPMIDVEVRNRWSKQQLRDSLLLFTQLIEDYYGCTPIIYTYETFFKDNLGVAFENYPLFIAKYSNVPPNIGTRAKWWMWQFSESGYFGSVKGNKGLVDLSRFNEGFSIDDILYRPGKVKRPRTSVTEAVTHAEKPATINPVEHKGKETKQTSKQKAEEKKKAEKEKKAQERKQKKAKEDAKKKAKEKEEADKKAKQKADQQKREQERKAAAQKAADEKAKRKAAAKKAREEKAKQNAAKQNKSTASVSTAYNSKLSQSQRNDSIRANQQKGRKINKSSADND